MRILFTFAGGRGHAAPLVPLARAARAAGHTVAFAGQPRLVPVLTALGFAAFATGPDVGRTGRAPLLAPDPAREEAALADSYAGWIARGRAADLLRVAADWRPAVLVCDEVDFGAMVAAERLGVPHASVLVLASGAFVRAEVVAPPLAALRAAHGLRPDPGLAMTTAHLVLSPFPPSLRDPTCPLPATARTLRLVGPAPDDPAPEDPGPEDPGPGGPVPGGRRRVYATLGTVFNLESGDLFDRLLAGLGSLPAEVVVTVGEQLDPTDFGPQPPNVRVERFVPQDSVLASCALMVSHGGSGSVLGALAHGVPMVVIPMGADQPHNAARVRALGLGLTLDPLTATPGAIGAAARAVLADPAYAAAARRVGGELVGLGGPDEAVTLLEALGDGG